jgi:hypothetical protein
VSKAGLHTLRALRAAAAELSVRRAPAKPSFTRKINEAHRTAAGVPKPAPTSEKK